LKLRLQSLVAAANIVPENCLRISPQSEGNTHCCK